MHTAARIALAATVWLSLGIPLWINTIEVDRAHLDYGELQRYESLASHQIETAIRVAARDAQSGDFAGAVELVMNRSLKEENSPYRFLISEECDDEVELCINSLPGPVDSVELDSVKKELRITYTNQTLASGFSSELARMLLLDHFYKDEVIPHAKEVANTREEVTVKYSPKYHITFSLFSEKGKKFDWEIGSALKNSFSGLLADLDTNVVSLSIDTQTGLYAEMGAETYLKDGVRMINKSQLSKFVDFAEWKLASSLPYPTLNFVLYIPDTPLQIENSGKWFSQFIVPQWGGVVIAEPQEDGKLLTENTIVPALDIFARQLLVLLGARETTDKELPSGGSTSIALARLSRDWALKGVKGAAASLGSLRRLAASMPHIAIPQEVTVNAEMAMREIDSAVELLKAGRHSKAGAKARSAYTAADRAFFDKHMVAQAYFPDEHKLAVYMPLIGPLCVVVLSGWVKILKRRKGRDQQGDETSTVKDETRNPSEKIQDETQNSSEKIQD